MMKKTGFLFFLLLFGVAAMAQDCEIVGVGSLPTCIPIKFVAPEGAINGLFSVSPSKIVWFSKGNLQYQASTKTWRFAERQWDYVGTHTPDYNGYVGGSVSGSDNRNVSHDYCGWIDLFGWGTSGYKHGANAFQPFSTSMINSDYYVYGDFLYNLCDLTGQADWGYNPISNGGNQANQWRTLTQQEWQYVINTRTTSSGIRFAMANVNNVKGVILLPDDWSTRIYDLNNTNDIWASFNSNFLTDLQWIVLENAGAIFLPAAGDRDGAMVYNVGFTGAYWSASNYKDRCAYCVYFKNGINTYTCRRYCGSSVRLVQDYRP